MLFGLIVASAKTAFAIAAASPPLSAEQDTAPVPPLGISANPGAVNQITGTGQAGASKKIRASSLAASGRQTQTI